MKRWTPILSILFLLVLCSVIHACPMCKDSIGGSDLENSGGVPGGMNTSIYYMLGGFMAVLGLVVTAVVKGTHRS